MEKKIITQAQRTTLFNEWLSNQSTPRFESTIDRQRWWVQKCIEHDRIICNEYDIVPDLYTDDNGKMIF